MITKAIIPVAGWGTRRLPITKTIEKCMLPIGNRPIVDYVVQDCIAAGITDIYFIVSEESTQLQSYYSKNAALDTYLNSVGKEQYLSIVQPPSRVNFHYITQPNNQKYGTAVPVALALPFLRKDESAVVVMGDDFVYNRDGSSDIARMIAQTPANKNAMLGVPIDKNLVSLYGVIDLDNKGDFVRIVEKPSLQETPSNLINVSKYILNYNLMQTIADYTERELAGEYYITEPINEYVLGGGLIKVVQAEGQYLDAGNVDGWLHANNVVIGGVYKK